MVPRRFSILQLTELEGVGDLKSVLASDMEMQSLEFAQTVFSFAFQYFLTMLPSLHFGIMYNLCHYVLEACDLFFLFDS